MAWLTEVKVSDTDVSGYVLDWKVKRSRDSSDVEPATVYFVQGITSLNIIKHNAQITIKRGITDKTDQFIFKGRIVNISIQDGVVRCDLRPPHWNLKRQLISEIFDESAAEAGDITEIWKTIAAGEDNEITVSAEDSTGLPSLNYFVCNGEERWEKAQELRKLIKWQSYYRPDTDTYYLEPEGFTEYGTELNVGQEILNNLKWNYDMESIRNDVKIIGAFDTARFQESFNGDGSTKTFTLTYIPVDTEVYIGSISQANLQTMGIDDSTETGFDYTVDKEAKTITFKTAPGSGTDNVIVNYSYLQQRPVRQKNKTSIENYGVSMYEVGYDTVLTIEDAKVQAQSIIDVYATPFKSTTLYIVDQEGLFPGNRIIVNDTQNEEIGTELTVNSIVYQYTSDHDVIEAGDKDYRIKDLLLDIIQNITQLYKRSKDNQEIVTDINLVEKDVYAHITKERYKATKATGVLYWGDEDQGTWGSFNWGESGSEDYSLIKRTHSKNLFYDDFTADHYINSTGSSGAAVNTSSGQLELSSGGIYLTEAIHIDDTLITQVTPTWELDSGSVKVEVRTDAGIWRQVTSGTTLFFSEGAGEGAELTSFAYTFPMTFTGTGDERGTSLFLRISENASSTATLKKIKIKING